MLWVEFAVLYHSLVAGEAEVVQYWKQRGLSCLESRSKKETANLPAHCLEIEVSLSQRKCDQKNLKIYVVGINVHSVLYRFHLTLHLIVF